MSDPSHDAWCPKCREIVSVNDYGYCGEGECRRCGTAALEFEQVVSRLIGERDHAEREQGELLVERDRIVRALRISRGSSTNEIIAVAAIASSIVARDGSALSRLRTSLLAIVAKWRGEMSDSESPYHNAALESCAVDVEDALEEADHE